MNKLPPAAAGLLEQARSEDRAHQLDLERSLSALHASLPFAVDPELTELADPLLEAVREASANGAGGTLSSLSQGALFTGKSIKVFLATVALGGALGGTAWVGSEPAARSKKPVVAPAKTPNGLHGETVPAAEVVQASPAVPAASVLVAAVSNAKRVRPVAGSRSTREQDSEANARASIEAQTSTASATQEPSAEAAPLPPSELDLIDGALSQLRSHHGEEALRLLALHQRLHAHGTFATERRGLRVLALCELGRSDEARREQAQFLVAHPNVPIAARVRQACAPKGR